MEKKERSFYEILIFIFINVIVFSVAMLIDNSDLAVTILGLLMPFNVAYWLMIYVFNNYKNKKEIVYDEEIDDDEMRDIYHEAGHVVIQLLTETPKKAYIRSVSIIREQYTDICYKSCSESKENLDQLLSFYMGGFCAEEVIYGFSNSSSYENQYDWNNIIDITSTIIKKYGYKNRAVINYSYVMRDTINEMGTDLLKDKKKEIKLLLQENRDLLEAIANALHEKGELNKEKIYEMYDSYKKSKTIN